jgi:hypothetical protein
MLAGIPFTDFLLCFFMTSLRASLRLYALLMSQTIKQMINSVPSSPYPNMVSPYSIQPLLFKGVASTVDLS